MKISVSVHDETWDRCKYCGQTIKSFDGKKHDNCNKKEFMKVSEKQLIILTDILKDTLCISGNVGGYSQQVRQQLTNDLINQQSNDLKELEDEVNSKGKYDDRPQSAD